MPAVSGRMAGGARIRNVPAESGVEGRRGSAVWSVRGLRPRGHQAEWEESPAPPQTNGRSHLSRGEPPQETCGLPLGYGVARTSMAPGLVSMPLGRPRTRTT
jgi:hypothetical protein